MNKHIVLPTPRTSIDDEIEQCWKEHDGTSENATSTLIDLTGDHPIASKTTRRNSIMHRPSTHRLASQGNGDLKFERTIVRRGMRRDLVRLRDQVVVQLASA